MSKYVAMKRITPNTKIEILEKDGRNYTIGKYIGYWNPERETFNLYAVKDKKCAFWPGGKIPEGKIVISDRQMYVRQRDFTDRPFLGKRGA